MIWIDYIFVVIVLAGLVFGLFTSVAVQVINLVSVVAGLVAAGLLRTGVAEWLCARSDWLNERAALTHRVVYILVFLAVVALAQVAGHLVRKLAKAGDRALAAVIGLLAALFLCVAIPALMIPAQEEGEESLMKRSVLMPYFARGIERTQGFMKPETWEQIKDSARRLWEQTDAAAREKLDQVKAAEPAPDKPDKQDKEGTN